ncbi:MAG: formylglycine-generating enzyme family protein [Bacteroidota bacterium]
MKHMLMVGILSLLLWAGCQPEPETPPAPAEVVPVRTPRATIPPTPPDVVVPEGMVYVPGGLTHIGTTDGLPEEAPVHPVEVESFFMQQHLVTVADFAAFVEATGYTTEAERFGNSGIFDTSVQQWTMVDGATWQQPFGPNGDPAPPDHPVTQVSWNDAVAYAEWRGHRLPTEAEWEHAARNARNDAEPYAWGASQQAEGQHQANTWQGQFPYTNTLDDGFATTSPVGHFGETPLGLTDMGGNVWEWTADWYQHYAARVQGLAYQPQGEPMRTIRGGSFLCDPSWCHGFRVSSRQGTSPETGLVHIGFRTVQDVP